jgi:hypothetical protein
MKTNTMKNNRKNKSWMRNPDQLKTPKTFQLTVRRNPDGSFFLPGGMQKVMVKRNQYRIDEVMVDTRDLAVELRNNPIYTY